MAEFCVAELACALGLTARAGRLLLGDAVELSHRLPRVWERLQAGDLPAWRARRVAQQTVPLPPDGAAYVDQHVEAVAHRVGPAQLGRLVDEARVRHDPEAAEELRQARLGARHLDIGVHDVRADGTVAVEGVLDLADALDLEHAVRREAQALAALGCMAPLAVRRSMAAGQIARGDTPLDLVLTVHVAASALAADAAPGELARVDGVPGFVSAAQVREWCGRPDARVLVRPVVDADQHVSVDAYEVSDRLRHLTGLRDVTCVFPWCTHHADRCDRDHVVPEAEGGATCSCNVAPLCRRHHRHKTHGRWRYRVVDPGTYLWTSPHGYVFLRDHTGTRDVTATAGAPAAHPAPAALALAAAPRLSAPEEPSGDRASAA
ncbi:HNH endonuclease [Nocardioides anomalus]|uniref:HNH endonuclease n=1 Tax=Nocardioides anomalus TaxID=2712223 RepID=A0A6G6WEY3_9ACTN|nr:HNH endonuclease signature motif containing protein [Nocardioides anomalus]QIG43600.1 HNH endonuclease [Nocardioides anomalus]